MCVLCLLAVKWYELSRPCNNINSTLDLVLGCFTSEGLVLNHRGKTMTSLPIQSHIMGVEHDKSNHEICETTKICERTYDALNELYFNESRSSLHVLTQ